MTSTFVLHTSYEENTHPNLLDFVTHLPQSVVLSGAWSLTLSQFGISKSVVKRLPIRTHINICCDLIDKSISGDQFIPILKRIYLKDNFTTSPPSELGVAVTVKQFDRIRLFITDDRGLTLPLDSNKPEDSIAYTCLLYTSPSPRD